jgi:hypothetical protein
MEVANPYRTVDSRVMDSKDLENERAKAALSTIPEGWPHVEWTGVASAMGPLVMSVCSNSTARHMFRRFSSCRVAIACAFAVHSFSTLD